MIKYQIGDQLKPKWSQDPDMVREIIDIRETGYGWKYPDLPDEPNNHFISENSSDPYFELGWIKIND